MRSSIPAFGRYLVVEGDENQINGLWISDTFEEGNAVGEVSRALQQLKEYEAKQRTEFELNLVPHGTTFQKSVWDVLLSIPYGETLTYGQIAEKIGNAKAVRAVGGACHNNPIGIVIPCHRVLGKDGSLTGYAGGVHLKEMLLNHEKKAD